MVFTLQDTNSMVIFNSEYVPLGDVIHTKRETAPDEAVVVYHDLVDAPRGGCPGFFSLTQRHKVWWHAESLPAEQEGPHKQSCKHILPLLCPSSFGTTR